MAINFNPSMSSISHGGINKVNEANGNGEKLNFGKAVGKYFDKVNDDQIQSDISIMDLLSGKNGDINTVVANVAKADMSFKLLIGVRNKLVSAYKETMKMQI